MQWYKPSEKMPAIGELIVVKEFINNSTITYKSSVIQGEFGPCVQTSIPRKELVELYYVNAWAYLKSNNDSKMKLLCKIGIHGKVTRVPGVANGRFCERCLKQWVIKR